MTSATDPAEAVRAFGKAFGAPLPGDDLRFDTRVTISLMELYESVRDGLNFQQFGDPEGREDVAEALVRKIHRDATTTTPYPREFASRSGE